MTKEYREYLKKNDPMAYSDLMGDPVTGLQTSSSSTILIIPILVLLLVGVFIGFIIFK